MEIMETMQITNVDLIFRHITHGDVSIKKGITMCKDGPEVGELIRMLAKAEMIDEQKYNHLMRQMSEEGLLDKFAAKEMRE